MPAYNKRLYLLYLLYLRRKNKTQKRRHWIHPINQARYSEGAFYTLFQKLQESPNKFFNYFRMSETTFEYLLTHLTDDIKKEDTHFRNAVSPKEMLAVTLRYLASGCSLTDLHYNYRLGVSTLSLIINYVCSKLWDTFFMEHLGVPTEEKWKNVAEGFEKKAFFPNCLGAIDGKHVRIINFPHGGSMYMNYKKYFSIVLLAVVDADYSFIFVDIGGYGKDCDSSIFQNTIFWKSLMERNLQIPQPKPISQGGLTVPYVFVADDAFPMNEHILRSYSGHTLSQKQRVYNYRHCRTRRYVECAFGIMSNKWRILHRPINVSPEFAKNIVKACVVLHNIVRKRDGYRDEDIIFSERSMLENLPYMQQTRSTNKSGSGVRATFADYFVSDEGSLPWQLSKI